ncbi:MAG TPA: BTAD domain-containing putative transcriptional regulator [Actinomycetota bacterium]|nr:BTAD domain-containing putative transcriptional regulator [Actinomycetota bacterium]
MIEVKVLGHLEVLRDGEPIRIPGDKERELLALLVIRKGDIVSTDQLIEQLWVEDLPNKPANALQAVVSRLRRALGGDVIMTKKPGYTLQLQPGSLDAERFEDLVRRATRVRADDPATGLELLAEATSLWRGSPFADFAYEDFAQEERARLEELHVTAAEEKVAADLALGRTKEVIAELERLVSVYPLRERLRGQLMIALYRTGRQGDAIAAYQEARRVLGEELGLDPGLELEDVYQLILRHDPSLQVTIEPVGDESQTNLPTRVTSFVGRETEIAEVTKLVRDSRLVTVVGPGGAGKTSFAIEVGRGLLDSFDRGVWIVELAPVSDPDLVATAIAEALGLSEDVSSVTQPLPPITRLGSFLRNKELLLILDNCEHVVQATAEIAETLITTCPKLTILATSREVLASSGEFVWPIPPLPFPEEEADFESIASYDAIRLFEQRATSAGRAVFLDEEGATAAAQICRRLDGLPLAIELAAARARSISLPEIARRLDQRFALLSAGGRTSVPRHRTLRAAIDWSHELLGPPERTVFRRLAIFSGGWTLEAAEEVCGDEEVGDVLAAHSRLVDQSLITARSDRFLMLETILAYARDHLAQASEEEILRERHARFFKAVAESIEPQLRGVDQGKALERLRADEHNLRLALQWGREHADAHPDVGLGLAASLGWYWYVGRQVEGRSELKSLLAAASHASEKIRARALQGLSLSLRPAGCIVHASPAAAEAARQSMSIFESAGETAGAAMSQLLVAVEGVAGGDVEGFLGMVDDARGKLRNHGDSWGVALADFVEMEIRLYHDSPDRALALGDQAARQFDALDDYWGRSAVRLHLGFGLRQAGRTQEAREVLELAVAISRETGLPYNLARSIAELGELAIYLGDPEEADRWFGECDPILSDLVDDTMQGLVECGRGDCARYRGEPAAALAHYDDALTLYRRTQVGRGVARALTGLAAAELDLDHIDRARELLEEGLTLAREASDPAIHATALEQLARLVLRGGHERDTIALVDEADEIRDRYRRPRGALANRDVKSTRLSYSSSANARTGDDAPR